MNFFFRGHLNKKNLSLKTMNSKSMNFRAFYLISEWIIFLKSSKDKKSAFFS